MCPQKAYHEGCCHKIMHKTTYLLPFIFTRLGEKKARMKEVSLTVTLTIDSKEARDAQDVEERIR